ncbi:Elongation factor 1-gamma [Lobulomyces angularis]|nr:Elongation factor 1-gamma [Lobulomyces angularis]
MPTSTITNSFDGKLFTLKDSSKARTLQMIANFNKINLEIIYVKDTADFKETNNFNDSFPLGKLPAYQSNDGFNLHQSDAIAHYLASKEGSKLNGTNAKEKCLIQQWSEFANVEFESTRAVLLFPMFGWTTANVQFEKKAIENLNLSLEVLNEHLLNNTFLVGERITLADIKLCSSLLDFFKFYFNDAFTSKFKCLTRWFNTIANQDYVKEVIGSTKYHKLKEIDSKPFKSDSNQIALGKELEGKNTAETDTLKTNLKKKSEKQEESLRNQNQTVLNKKKFTYIVEHMEGGCNFFVDLN